MAQADNYKALEDQLNKNEAMRNEFLKNPSALLQQHGVTVPHDQEAALHTQLQSLHLPTGKEPAKLKFPKIHIGIKIVVSTS